MIASSNLAIRQVLLLQQIQEYLLHCLLALIFNMYCLCISTTIS
jgi:hypothetical protein